MADPIIHPKPRLDEYRLVNQGKEAALYQIPGRRVVHKFWRQDWILSTYPMFNSSGQIFIRAAKRAAKRFNTSSMADTDRTESKSIAHRGIPLGQFRRITFVLSHVSQDILNQARAAGIPSPAVARVVPHPTKDLYVLELTDVSKPGHKIISGNDFVRDYKTRCSNFNAITGGIDEDRKILLKLGYEEDSPNHPPNSAWLVRLNEKTGKAKRFLWDVTNLRIIP
jgi:hypothetical protein